MPSATAEPPASQFVNAPFSDPAFLARADAAIAADRASETAKPSATTATTVPDSALAKPASTGVEAATTATDTAATAAVAATENKPTVPDLKSDIKAQTPSARAFAEQRKRIAELEAQNSKLAAAPVAPDIAKYEKLLEEANREKEELSTRLMTVGIERHETFKTEVTTPMEQLITTAKSVVPEEMVDRVETALRMPVGKARDKIFEDLSTELTPRQQSIVNMVDMDTQKVMRRRDELLSKPRELWSKIESESKASQERESAALQKVFDSTLEKAMSPDEGMFVFQDREGQAEWNREAGERRELARSINKGNLSPEAMARAAIWSAAAPALASQLEILAKENESLKSEVAKLTTAKPKVDGGGAEQHTNGETSKPGQSYTEAAIERASGIFNR